MSETQSNKTKKESKRGWYVLRAISGKEAKVKELLDGAIKNSTLGDHLFQVLLPMEKVVTVKGGKKVIKERNMYSGYVFVECELTGELIHELTNTTNVIDFLRGRGKDAKPERLTEADVNRMMHTADEMSDIEENPVIDFMVGEKVVVTDGPFATFNGKIEDILSDKNKLKVSVKIFGRETMLELDTWQVKRI